MTNINNTDEPGDSVQDGELTETNNEINTAGKNDPGQYVAAFFMVLKAGDPQTRHRDDRYIRETMYPPVVRKLGFINWQQFGPDVPTYISVLYQKAGSSDFTVQLMEMNKKGRSGELTEFIWRDGRTDRHIWDISQQRGDYRRPFKISMDGNRIKIALDSGQTASSNGPGQHQSALWKFNNDERPIDITMTQLGPFDQTINIPSREQMLSGDEFRDANFSGIEFYNLSLRACNLPKAIFAESPVNNVKFDMSVLTESDFSLEGDWYSPDMVLRDVSFNRADLTDAKFDRRPMENCKFERTVLEGDKL